MDFIYELPLPGQGEVLRLLIQPIDPRLQQWEGMDAIAASDRLHAKGALE